MQLSRPTPLFLIGAGGFGRETAEAVRAVNSARSARTGAPRWDLLGFLDDDAERWGTEVSGTTVVGAINGAVERPEAEVVVCTGHPADFTSKRRIVERLALAPGRYATVVHPSAVIPASCRVGEGTVVLAGVVATVDVEIGAHVGLMPQVVLTHDDRLADFVTVGAGVRLAGGVTVRESAYLGSGCLVREQCTIGAGALVGMGSVVTHDVPAGEVWAGVPARHLRKIG